MGIFIGVLCFIAFIVLVTLGHPAMVDENEKRISEWARSQNVELLRIERDSGRIHGQRPAWRLRVRMPNGDVRDCIGRAGWSIYEPIEIEWAKPGESVFR